MADLALLLPPGLLLILGAAVVPLLPQGWHARWPLAVTLLGLMQVLALPSGTFVEWSWLDLELVPVRVDTLSSFFGIVFSLAAVLCALYAASVRDPLQHVAMLAYMGGAIGAIFAGDLITLFVYWELTALTSVFLIWARRSEASYHVGMRYLLIQVGSGVILLAAVVLAVLQTGSTIFGHVGTGDAVGNLLLLAFGIKAAFPLLHNWLHDAYPNATPLGAVVMSCFTTKMAIYALARGFSGEPVLIALGAVMAVFTVFYALVENDLRRVVTYGLQAQLGLILIGLGVGTAVAVNGAVLHAAMGVFYVALLLMALGAVLERTGSCRATDLGGLFRRMPWTAAFALVGGAAISAFPLLNGYVSKSPLFASVAEQGLGWAWLAMIFSSAGIFLALGIRLPWLAFFAERRGPVEEVQEAPRPMLIAMAATAAVCVLGGLLPQVVYGMLPYPMQYHPYSLYALVNQLQLLAVAGLVALWWMRRGRFPVLRTGRAVDSDWLYLNALPRLVNAFLRVGGEAWRGFLAALQWPLTQLLDAVWRHHGPQGVLARTWPTGSMVLWVAVLLAASMIVYYF